MGTRRRCHAKRRKAEKERKAAEDAAMPYGGFVPPKAAAGAPPKAASFLGTPKG